MTKTPDPISVMTKTIMILGGRERLREAMDEELSEMTSRWDQDIDSIGRILRSHLYVEFYMTDYLQKSNPILGSLKSAKLSFAQKLALLDPHDSRVKEILEGLKHLNAIRNRLAHRLNAIVGPEDSAIFLRAEYFGAMRVARFLPVNPSDNPLDILEDFAKYATSTFTHKFSVVGQAFTQALNELRDSEER